MALRAVRVSQLATHFDGYQQIPKIAEIRHTIDSINTQLNEQVRPRCPRAYKDEL